MECIKAGSLRAFWLAERTIRCAQMLLFFAASALGPAAVLPPEAPIPTAQHDEARGSAQHGGAWQPGDEFSRLHYVSKMFLSTSTSGQPLSLLASHSILHFSFFFLCGVCNGALDGNGGTSTVVDHASDTPH